VVEHELGHILGLPDTGQAGVMNIALDSGERRLPAPADVAAAPAVIQQTQPQQNATPPAPVASTAPADSSGGFTSEAYHGNNFGFGGGTAQNIAFAQFNPTPPTWWLPGALANFFKGDGFDFSAFTSQSHTAGVTDAMPIHVSDTGPNLAAAFSAPDSHANLAHSGDAAIFGPLFSHFEQFHFGLLT
jgi:hypothetical protein